MLQASFYQELLRGGRGGRADELVLLPPPGEERGRGSRGRGRGRKRKLGPAKPVGKVSSERALHDDDEGDGDERLQGLVDEWNDVVSVAESDSAVGSEEIRPESQSDLQMELEELMRTELTERMQAATAGEDATAQSVEEPAATINGEDAAARALPAREQDAAEVKDAPAPAPPTAGEQTAALGEDAAAAAAPAAPSVSSDEDDAVSAAKKILHQSGAGKLGSRKRERRTIRSCSELLQQHRQHRQHQWPLQVGQQQLLDTVLESLEPLESVWQSGQ